MSTPSDFNFPDFSTLLHAEPKDDFFQYSKFQLYNAVANTTLNDLMNTRNHAYLKLLDAYNRSQADHDHAKSELNHLRTELTHLCEVRLILNPMKNLVIPPPSAMIPETAAPSQPVVVKRPNSKPLQPKDGVTTARHLYATDYHKAQPNATEAKCSAAWKACDAATKK
ncbi:hypothetical protein C0993_009792, partial [Termitomyces sp. T159_Od127]